MAQLQPELNSSVRRLVIQISDTHLVAEGLVHGTVDTAAQLAGALERLVASPVRPDLLLLSGDLSNSGEEDSYRRLQELVEPAAAALGCPVCYMPGNHDDREALRSVLLDGRGDGPLDQIHWMGGLRLVALDSTVPGHHHGRLEPGQLSFLDEVLAQPAPEGTLLAIHHPPLPSPVKIAQLLSLRRPEDLAAVIAGRDVLMVVSGHTHHCAAGLLGQVPVWVCGASSYQADVLAEDHLMRSIPGLSLSRIDVADKMAVATAIAVDLDGGLVDETDITGVEEWLRRTGAFDDDPVAG